MNDPKEVSYEEVRHMASLSRLEINTEEERRFARQFAQILGHMEILKGVDTTDIEPMYNVLDLRESTREDKAINLRSHQEILSNAPETDGEYFLVPRIV